MSLMGIIPPCQSVKVAISIFGGLKRRLIQLLRAVLVFAHMRSEEISLSMAWLIQRWDYVVSSSARVGGLARAASATITSCGCTAGSFFTFPPIPLKHKSPRYGIGNVAASIRKPKGVFKHIYTWTSDESQALAEL